LCLLSSAPTLTLAKTASSPYFSRRCFREKTTSQTPLLRPQTCAWLLQHTEDTTWLRQNRETLWIKGKPGAGKSALIKNALRDAKERADDKARAARDKPVVASFFFHGRGSSIQKSPLGMFRSLLHQILDQISERSDVKRMAGGERGGSGMWRSHEHFSRSLSHKRK